MGLFVVFGRKAKERQRGGMLLNDLTKPIIDEFTVSVSGKVITPPFRTENGALFFRLRVTSQRAPFVIEVIAKKSAAEIDIDVEDRVYVSCGKAFVSDHAEKKDCAFSVMVDRKLQLHLLPLYEGIKDIR